MYTKKLKIAFTSLLVITAFSMALPANLLAPQTGITNIRPGVHRFLVEIDGIVTTSFESVSGLESAISVIEYRDGASQTTQKLAVIAKYSNIILRFPLSNAKELWDWHRKILNGTNDKRNMSIVVLNNKGDQIVRYQITNAWPCA